MTSITTISELTALAKEVAELDKKRTQGGWFCGLTGENEDEPQCIIIGGDGLIFGRIPKLPGVQGGRFEVNARFIATAPDMAAGLQFAVQEIERQNNYLEEIKDWLIDGDNLSALEAVNEALGIRGEEFFEHTTKYKAAIAEFNEQDEQALNHGGDAK